MGYSRKNPNKVGGGGLRIYFFEKNPGIFHFFTLPLEIPDKTKLTPWIFHKIVLDLLEIPRPKTKTLGNSTLFFLGHPWKFHMLFLWYSSKFYILNPSCLDFFWKSPMTNENRLPLNVQNRMMEISNIELAILLSGKGDPQI